jgi:hypothetical protein
MYGNLWTQSLKFVTSTSIWVFSENLLIEARIFSALLPSAIPSLLVKVDFKVGAGRILVLFFD